MELRFADTSVVIVGAGFSASVTNGSLPLMRNYFDQLDGNRFKLLFEFVSSVASNVATANVERVLVCLDQIRTSPDELVKGWAETWKARVGDLQSELAHYTLERLRNSLQIPEDSWAADAIAGCGERTTVISMNYDNITERLLSCRPGMVHGMGSPTCPHCKMRRLMRLACSCEGRGDFGESDWRGSVLKPHGSIAWRRCLNRSCCSYQCLVADEHCLPFNPHRCPDCGDESHPVLVMPTMSKNLNDIPQIAVMWQAAKQAIAEAESILLFGFSMPASDELLAQMIRQAIASSRRLHRIASIDLEPEQVIDRFGECVPNDLVIEATPLRVTLGVTPSWLTKAV